MSGSPLLRLALVLIGLALLAIPATRLIGRKSPATTPPPASSNPSDDLRSLTLKFSAPLLPDEIQIRSADTVLTAIRPTEIPISVSISIPIPAAGTDLIVSATWPQAAPSHALRIQASLPSRPLVDVTLWSDEGTKLEDILPLPGIPKP